MDSQLADIEAARKRGMAASWLMFAVVVIAGIIALAVL